MLKYCSIIIALSIALMIHCQVSAEESTPILYELETNQNFIIDYDNSAPDCLRICVPVAYPEWFTIPIASVNEIQAIEEKTIDGKNLTFALIEFKEEYAALNSILDSFQEIICDESTSKVGVSNKWGWRPPWTWSKCAKCKLEVNIYITVSVIAAAAAAGVTGPGAYAVYQAAIIGQYGLAAWKAVEAGIFSMGVGEICKKICEAQGKC